MAVKLLGEKLMQMGKLSATQVDTALRIQKHLLESGLGHKRFRDILIERRYVTEADILDALQSEGVVGSDAALPIDIPAHICQRLKIKVLGIQGPALVVAPLERLTAREIEDLKEAAFRAGVLVSDVRQVEMDNAEILKSLSERTIDAASLQSAIVKFNQNPDNGTVSEIIRSIIQDAIQSRASDIHIDKDNDASRCSISYRIDGIMRQRYLLTPGSAKILVSRTKNESGMDFSDTRHPQDGRLDLPYQQRRVDIRVASLPTSGEGETITMRVLDPNNLKSVDILLREHQDILKSLKQVANIQYKTPGLVLITGPTGTGKSTTLYGLLNSMNKDELNIMSSEDPIEQIIPGIRQSVVNEAAGMTYANILRAQMRQDPDVLVVGEVRDQITAEAILRGAESGHLMFSTVHASSVVEAMYRLLNLLTDTYRPIGILTIAHHLKAVTNQRLGRRICSCHDMAKAGDVAEAKVLDFIGLGASTLVPVKKGCDKCNGTGYFGRILVPEALFIGNSDKTKEGIVRVLQNGSNPEEITHVPGVEFHSRIDSVKRLMRENLLDIGTAMAVLGDAV